MSRKRGKAGGKGEWRDGESGTQLQADGSKIDDVVSTLGPPDAPTAMDAEPRLDLASLPGAINRLDAGDLLAWFDRLAPERLQKLLAERSRLENLPGVSACRSELLRALAAVEALRVFLEERPWRIHPLLLEAPQNNLVCLEKELQDARIALDLAIAHPQLQDIEGVESPPRPNRAMRTRGPTYDPRADEKIALDWAAAKREGQTLEAFSRARGGFASVNRALDRVRARKRQRGSQ